MQGIKSGLLGFKKSWKRHLKNLILMLIGAFIAGVSVNMFFMSTQLTMGGFSGLAAVIYNVTGLPISMGTITVLLNLPVFLLGLFYVSKKFIVDSLIGTFVFSFMIDFSKWVLDYLKWDHSILSQGDGTADLLLCSLFGGAVFGVGLGIMIMAGYTTGGTDICAVVMRKKWKNLSIGMGIWIVDAIVIGLSVLAYQKTNPQSFRLGLYSCLALLLTSKALDLIIEGFNYKRTAMIISSASEPIAQRLMQELDRGVTGLSGKGMYSKNENTVLICVLPYKQIPELKAIVAQEDPKAFVFVMDTREVLGEGFEGTEPFA